MPETIRIELPAGKNEIDWSRGSIFFVGTATVLLRYGGFTILTDPNFLHRGDHVQFGYGLKSRRLTEPAISISELPPIDFVAVSHFHGDHFDPLVQKELDRNSRIVTTRQGADALRAIGFRNVVALRTWDSLEVAKAGSRVRLTAMPGRHAPKPLGRLIPPVMGSMIEFLRGPKVPLRVYLSGDTLMQDQLNEIPRRYPEIDVSLLHLGGARIAGALLTMDAAQGVAAVKLINARKAIPIHYDDYTVFKSPLSEFARSMRDSGLEDRVQYLARGETYEIEVPAERL